MIGYILRVHPAWTRFIEIARTLGTPLVMRMNLNQQSHGRAWDWHRNLMASMSPIVDCGVHYVDVMCQMTGARPIRVSAIGARLTDDLQPGMYNYGQLQVTFEDGSVGWYEAGWGPMMSEVAFFVKDVIGPKGCVSIVKDPNDATATGSDDIDSHTKTNCLRLHHSALDANNEFVKADEFISTEDEPDHQGLCDREQAYLLRAITEDLDLSAHMQDAVNSLRIVLAADESFRTGQTVRSVTQAFGQPHRRRVATWLRIQSASSSSETLPSASAMDSETASASVASNWRPLIPKNVTIARNPMRLLPSRYGWFFTKPNA